MDNNVLQKLGNKIITKKELFQELEQNQSLLPTILEGLSSSKATIRYGCAGVLMDFSENYPERLYPQFETFVNLMNSKHRILTWNALAIIANLTRVDKEGKFDEIFDKYYDYLNDEYMVTVANVVGNSAKIAIAKPYLAERITSRLLSVENIKTTPHLTAECKRVIVQHAIKSLDLFFNEIESKEQVLSFVKRQTHSTRATLRKEALDFLKKRNRS
jgi:hypothetical protein